VWGGRGGRSGGGWSQGAVRAGIGPGALPVVRRGARRAPARSSLARRGPARPRAAPRARRRDGLVGEQPRTSSRSASSSSSSSSGADDASSAGRRRAAGSGRGRRRPCAATRRPGCRRPRPRAPRRGPAPRRGRRRPRRRPVPSQTSSAAAVHALERAARGDGEPRVTMTWRGDVTELAQDAATSLSSRQATTRTRSRNPNARERRRRPPAHRAGCGRRRARRSGRGGRPRGGRGPDRAEPVPDDVVLHRVERLIGQGGERPERERGVAGLVRAVQRQQDLVDHPLPHPQGEQLPADATRRSTTSRSSPELPQGRVRRRRRPPRSPPAPRAPARR
jgi:hypothetical protein